MATWPNKLNLGYDSFGSWTATQDNPYRFSFGGFFNGHIEDLKMGVLISPDGRDLDVNIRSFKVVRDYQDQEGWGFLDFQAFAWWDPESCRTLWPEVYFPNSDDFHLGQGYRKPLAWPILWREIQQVVARQDPGNVKLWQNTFFWMWQLNVIVPDNLDFTDNDFVVAHGHYHWDLTESDYDEYGALKDRPIFFPYGRHSDAAGVHEATTNSAHWAASDPFMLSDMGMNWKYHPFRIRKNGQWYSCNRISGEDGYGGEYGDGHVWRRLPDGTKDAVWNDDFRVQDSEGLYDSPSIPGKSPRISSPRTGIGHNPFRPIGDPDAGPNDRTHHEKE